MRRTIFEDIINEDTGSVVFAYLLLNHMPSTLATCKKMKLLTKQRVAELLSVAKILNSAPFSIPINGFMSTTDLRVLRKTIDVKAFTNAITSGALAKLTHLYLYDNQISDAGTVRGDRQGGDGETNGKRKFDPSSLIPS